MQLTEKDKKTISEIFGNDNPVFIADLINNIKITHKQIEQLEQQLKEARKHLAESVAKECKCEVNISVNNDLVSRNLELKKLLERIAGMCGNPIASDGCRGILKLHKEYLTKYKVKE